MNKQGKSVLENSALNNIGQSEAINNREEAKEMLLKHIEMLLKKNLVVDEGRIKEIVENVKNDSLEPDEAAELVDLLTKKN